MKPMLPIVDYPPLIAEEAVYFQDLFSRPQYQHFQRYVTGVMVAPEVNVSAIAGLFFQGRDRSCLDRFLLEANWSAQEVNRRRVERLNSQPQTASQPGGALIIDDTLTHKTGSKMEGAGRFYDSSAGRYVWGHNLVTCNYAKGQVSWPINFRVYRKREQCEPEEFQTKLELACELIGEAVGKLGVKASVVLFDSWYLCPKLAEYIASLGLDWISEAKSNRMVWIARKRMSLAEYAASLPTEAFREAEIYGRRYWYFSRCLWMSKLGKVRVAIAYPSTALRASDNAALEGEPKFLVTNRLDWEKHKILRTYTWRWEIEAFYREVKQHLGLEDYQLRGLRGILRHWCLVLVAYSFLKLSGWRDKLVGYLAYQLGSIGARCRLVAGQVLQGFIFWVCEQVKRGLGAEAIGKQVFGRGEAGLKKFSFCP